MFRTASESARTILDSNASVSTWRASTSTTESLDISYKPLDFDHLLFTSFVYKRNFRIKRAIRTKTDKAVAAPEEHTSDTKSGKVASPSILSLSTISAHSIVPDIKEDEPSHDLLPEIQSDDSSNAIYRFQAIESTVLCPTDQSPSGRLIQAINNRALELARKSITRNVSINAVYQGKISSTFPWGTPVDHRRYTLLQLAVGMKHTAVVALVLSHHALVDLRTSQTPRPIIVACQSGNIEVLRLLVEHGAFIDCHPVDDDHAPIHAAVASRNAELVKYLCGLGANVESRTKSTGYTPLELACLFQEPLILESLLEMGAKPFSSYDGFSWIRRPHNMAMLEHNHAVVEKLNVLDPAIFHQGEFASGSTVLHELFDGSFGDNFSGSRNSFLARLHLLLRLPGLLSIPDKSGNLPLHTAAAKLDANWKYTPLFIDEVICLLVAVGADVLALNDQGHDALYLACQAGGAIAVTSLLKCGAVVGTDSEHQSHYGAILRPNVSAEEWFRLQGLLNEAVEKQTSQQQRVTSEKRGPVDTGPIRQPDAMDGHVTESVSCDLGTWI